ncbi:MAG: excinuclease ABC subunit UvrC [Candidatus Woesearchaeota archaeon]
MAFSIENYKIPKTSGCYLFKDNNEEIIYVGKAKNLKNRVKSYFNNSKKRIKTRKLVERINDVDFIITPTEVEALLLEQNLIKKHRPKYNVLLKDSKKYPYLVLTNEDFPRLLVTRRKNLKGEYFGPYTINDLRNNIVRLLRKRFFIRTCRTFPKRPCLRHQIEICQAPCIGKVTKKEYSKNIEKVRDFLKKGDTKKIINKLKKEMKEYSESQKFEKAKEKKDQISAIKEIENKQIIEQGKKSYQDVINYVEDEEKVRIMVFYVRNGILTGKDSYTIDATENFLEEFIKTYYSEKSIPKTIIIPEKINDQSIIDYLEKKADRKVKLVNPKRGLKKGLLELAKKNITEKYKKKYKQIIQLKEKLNLKEDPSVIECFDISHNQGSEMVASMVRFKDGKPDKKNYRRFKIRTVKGIDDFRAMKEVVNRRYKRLIKENKDFPNLILIDGGKIQLDFARKALNNLNIDIPIISIAKKEEEIFTHPKKDSININNKEPMMQLLIRIRDEAHRFGINYHRLRRSKSLKDQLDD